MKARPGPEGEGAGCGHLEPPTHILSPSTLHHSTSVMDDARAPCGQGPFHLCQDTAGPLEPSCVCVCVCVCVCARARTRMPYQGLEGSREPLVDLYP